MLTRPEGLARLKQSIEEMDYQNVEYIEVVDNPRLGISKRVNEGFRRSTGDYICFVADDTEFFIDTLNVAVAESIENKKGLVALNTESKTNCKNEHFLISRSLVERLGGEIFSEKFNHVGVDNLLWYKCEKLGEAMRSTNAKLKHYHFTNGGSKMDPTYELGWSKAKEDREILKKELIKLNNE